MGVNNTSKRVVYLDYLRIFSTFAVIFLHVSAQNWYSASVFSTEWQILNFYDSLVRWAVPVFVMISGALFLSKEISIRTLYLKHVLRMIIAFVVWSFVYAICQKGGYDFSEHKVMWLAGHYHMWFIPMIIGLYIMIPIIKYIVRDEKITHYFLILAAMFSFLLPTLFRLVGDFGNKALLGILAVAKDNIGGMNIHLVAGFSPTLFWAMC